MCLLYFLYLNQKIVVCKKKVRKILSLQISDPISMTAVVGIVTSGLLIILVAFMITGYSYKRRTFCFKDTISVKGSTKTRSNAKSSKKVRHSIAIKIFSSKTKHNKN